MSKKMDGRKLDGFQIEEETHRRDREDFDQYSSSESCSKIRKPTRKTKQGNCKRKDNNIQQICSELSSIVPPSNKDDEDSLLGNATNYLNSVQEHANIFEEQKKNILISKAWAFGDNNIGESSFSKKNLPEIEAKARGKDVLIRVHCENQKGYFTKVLGEIEKLHLNVENISSMPFGNYFLDITVTAKMNDEFFKTTKDLKRQLSEALQQFM